VIEPVSPAPPERVRVAAMRQRWTDVSFLHWPVDAARVRDVIPSHLEVDTFDGAAWVGLVAFRNVTRPPVGPRIPWLSEYLETNVRTYVVDGEGRRATWFLSLDVDRAPVAAAGRATLGLPYAWSAMSLERAGRTVSYRARRRAPASGTTSAVTVHVGAALERREIDALPDFLTARFRLFGVGPFGAYDVPIEHPQWPLRRATATEVDDRLIAAGGLPQPTGEPLVHASSGLEVRIGLPRRLRT
jgi:uncharacterized protein YqjF (DUF2071 family)